MVVDCSHHESIFQVNITKISVDRHESADHLEVRKYLFEKNYEVVSIDPREEVFVKKSHPSSNRLKLM